MNDTSQCAPRTYGCGCFERAWDDRSWAPPGGISIERITELSTALEGAFREELAAAGRAAGMCVISARSPWISEDPRDVEGESGWWVHVGIVRDVHVQEGDLLTNLAVTPCPRDDKPRPLDAQLSGPAARDPRLLARAVVEVLRPLIRNGEAE